MFYFIHNHVTLCMTTMCLALCVPASMITEMCLQLDGSPQCFFGNIYMQRPCHSGFFHCLEMRKKIVAVLFEILPFQP